MKKKDVDKMHQKITRLVVNNHLREALKYLSEIIQESHSGELKIQLENHIQTYRSLLNYTFEGIKDPQQQAVYSRLKAGILNLSDQARESLLNETPGLITYQLKKKILHNIQTDNEAAAEVEALNIQLELASMMRHSALQGTGDSTEYHKAFQKLFNRIWLTEKYHDAEIALVNHLREASAIPWHEKCLIVSAITLSLLRCFDDKKFELLMDFYEINDEQIHQRALVGLVLNFHLYDQRLQFYPQLFTRFSLYDKQEQLQQEIEAVVFQLIRSKDTERVTQKLQDEILPEMMKMAPRISEKLDLDEMLSDEFLEEKNPDWESMFTDSPEMMDKLTEFSNLQMEGADVYMSAFSRLKHFPFFNELSNWLLPFYPEQTDLKKMSLPDTETTDLSPLLESLGKSPFLCNSDKYSFALNLQVLPVIQRKMLTDFLRAELDNLNELQAEDEMLNLSQRSRFILNQYVQDVYRFFKLHPWKNEFNDIFNHPLKIYQSQFFKTLVTDHTTFRRIGEFYFEKNYFQEALDIYLYLKQEGEIDNQVFEKIAYCHQLLGNYSEALNFYKQAELFDTNRAWNLKKIGWCHRQLNQAGEAIKYYQEAEKLEPENRYIQILIGHCHLDLKQYNQALNYYYQVELNEASNIRILRPIAWCLLLSKKFEKAKSYYHRLLEHKANKHDLINLGHVEWCLGNPKTAAEYYLKSLLQNNNNPQAFLNSFDADQPMLLENGIDPSEIPLMRDHVIYQLG